MSYTKVLILVLSCYAVGCASTPEPVAPDPVPGITEDTVTAVEIPVDTFELAHYAVYFYAIADTVFDGDSFATYPFEAADLANEPHILVLGDSIGFPVKNKDRIVWLINHTDDENIKIAFSIGGNF